MNAFRVPSPTGESRRAAILVLAALVMVLLLVFVAFVVDLGVIALASDHLQNAADAGALAGASQLVPDAQPPFPLKSPLAIGVNVPGALAVNMGLNLSTSVSALGLNLQVIQPQVLPTNTAAAIQAARDVAAENRCLQINSLQTANEDVQVFYQSQPSTPLPLIPIPGVDSLLNALVLASTVDTRPNAARVTIRSDASGNCLLPLYFAPMLGMTVVQKEKSATGMICHGYTAVKGARILPIGMDVTIWRALRLGNGVVNGIPIAHQLLGQNGAPIVLVDEQRWDASTKTVQSGSDGIWEALLITEPLANLSIPGLPPGLSSPQNIATTVATLRLTSNQTDAQLVQQIQQGLSTGCMPKSNLTLPYDVPGEKTVSNAVLGELENIIGQPCVIPLYATLSGTVLNTVNQLLSLPQNYQIVGWGGCVVTEVKRLPLLTVIKVQPAPYSSSYIRQNQSGQPAYSDLVYTGPRLVR